MKEFDSIWAKHLIPLFHYRSQTVSSLIFWCFIQLGVWELNGSKADRFGVHDGSIRSVGGVDFHTMIPNNEIVRVDVTFENFKSIIFIKRRRICIPTWLLNCLNSTS